MQRGYYYRIMGCFILLKTKSFDCGMFDEITFLFGEGVYFISRKTFEIEEKCYFSRYVSFMSTEKKTISRSF
jgi:hypothetical protein